MSETNIKLTELAPTKNTVPLGPTPDKNQLSMKLTLRLANLLTTLHHENSSQLPVGELMQIEQVEPGQNIKY